MLDHIDTPDDYTAVFNLKTPSSQFMGFLAWYATFVLPKHLYDGTDWSTNPVNQTPIGSGPFKFVDTSRAITLPSKRSRTTTAKARTWIASL